MADRAEEEEEEARCRSDTDWYLALLAKARCAVWALENAPSLLRKYEGVYPTSRLFNTPGRGFLTRERRHLCGGDIANGFVSLI